MTTKLNIAFVWLCCCMISNVVRSQCPARPDELPSTCATGIPLVDGANINTGEEHYVSGGTVTITNVNLNGGTIKVCPTGVLNIVGINFNSGRIVNLSTLNVTTNIALQGSNFSIFNGPSGFIDMADNDIIINSEFVNLGRGHFKNITVNGSAAICLGDISITSTINLISNPNNAVDVPNGEACFGYNGTALLNGTFTASPGLTICAGPSASPPAPFDFGAATVTTNCNSCESRTFPLPVLLSEFTALPRPGEVYLKWTTASEINSDRFIVERSANGRDYDVIGQVPASGNTSTNMYYSFVDHSPISAVVSYYRLRQVDADGKQYLSQVIRIRNTNHAGFAASVMPNPAGATLNLLVENAQNGEHLMFEIINANGMIVYRQSLTAGGTTLIRAIPRPAVSAGVYFYRVTREANKAGYTGRIVLE